MGRGHVDICIGLNDIELEVAEALRDLIETTICMNRQFLIYVESVELHCDFRMNQEGYVEK